MGSRKVSGAMYREATIGGIVVRAGAVAIGMPAAGGPTAIDTIVAVYRWGEVVTPCGMGENAVLALERKRG